jgi:hypothetical protein
LRGGDVHHAGAIFQPGLRQHARDAQPLRLLADLDFEHVAGCPLQLTSGAGAQEHGL